MIRRFFLIYISVLFLFTISACSKSSDEESPKGAVDTFTENVANEGLDMIQTPITKAKDLENMSEERLKAMNESMEE